jgi:hypothetical protein
VFDTRVIESTIKSRNYAQGLVILESAGAPVRQYQPYRYASVIPDSVIESIMDDLRELLDAMNPMKASSSLKMEAMKKVAPTIRFLTRLKEAGRQLKKRESYLHAIMVDTADHPDTPARRDRLYQLARDLMEVEYELDKVYGDIRSYESSNQERSEQLADRKTDLIRRKRNLQAAKSRYHRQLKEASSQETKKRAREKMDARQHEIDQINKELFYLKIEKYEN